MSDETNGQLADEMAADLRTVAAMVEENPVLAAEMAYTFGLANVPLTSSAAPRQLLADFIRAARKHGATVTKEHSENWGGVTLHWRRVGLHVYAHRDQVCEKVVTGTETVTRTVPDPTALAAVPQIEVTETVERVEWICASLLAADAAPAAAS